MLFFFFINSSFAAVFNSVSASELIEDSWNTKTPMSQARYGLGVVTVDDKIYAIGGVGPEEIVGTNERYDPFSDTWITLEPMPTPRSFFAIASYQNKIYCIGGLVPGEWTLSPSRGIGVNEVYDTVTNSWSSKASFPDKLNSEDSVSISRLCIQACVVDGKIFVIMENDVDGNTIYMYDIIADLWTAKVSIPVTSLSWIYPVSAVIDDKIIVTGHNAQKLVVYDPKTDMWSERKTNSIIRAEYVTGVASGMYAPKRIYILGTVYDGSIPANLRSINQVYNPEKNTWSTGKAMPTIRSGFGVAVINDVLYVIGGRTNEYGTPILSLNEQYVPIGYDTLPSDTKSPLKGITIVAVALILIIGIGCGVLFYFRKRNYVKEKLYGHVEVKKNVNTSCGLCCFVCFCFLLFFACGSSFVIRHISCV